MRVAQGEGETIGPRSMDRAIDDLDHLVAASGEMAHRQPTPAVRSEHERRLLPKPPGRSARASRSADGRRDRGRDRQAGMAQDRLDDACLGAELLRVGEVLPRAASASGGVRTGRDHTVRRRLQHLHEVGEDAVTDVPSEADADLLAWDRPVHQ